MGIFFRAIPATTTPVRTTPVRVPGSSAIVGHEPEFEQMAQEIDTGAPVPAAAQAFLWGRLLFAVVVLVVVFVAGIYCDTHGPELKPWGDMLMHSFTLLFGVFLGLLAGEATRR